jgi:hypothetical protein
VKVTYKSSGHKSAEQTLNFDPKDLNDARDKFRMNNNLLYLIIASSHQVFQKL